MNIAITLDPRNKHPHLSDHQLLESCGLLKIWLVEGEQPTLKERLLASYAFYSGPMEGGTITAEGVYSYPQDPDLYALIKFETDEEFCFVFEYGIVGIVNKISGDTWVTRMD